MKKTKDIAIQSFKSFFMKLGFTTMAMHIFVSILYYNKIDALKSGRNFFLDMFYMEFEKNIPAFVSAFFLLTCGYLLHQLSAAQKEKGQAHKSAKGLGFVFYFLAADEWFSIHEQLLQIPNYFNIPSWLFVYIPLALIVLVSSIPFLKSLPKAVFWKTILAGLLFVTGAVFCEIAIEFIPHATFGNFEFQLYIFLQEAGELAGSLLFIVTLLLYLNSDFAKESIAIPYRALIYLCLFCFVESAITYGVKVSENQLA